MIPTSLLKIGHWFYVNTRFGRWHFNRSINQVAVDAPMGHSAPLLLDYGMYHVRIVSYSKNNYGFIIWCDKSNKCIIVDPGYFPPFYEILLQLNLVLDTVLITHKHIDHCGGLSQIKAYYPNVKVYSHRDDKIKYTTNSLQDSISIFEVCEENDFSIPITAYSTPGHTVGHTVYTMLTGEHGLDNYQVMLVFTGDNIFLGSIGAMFECSAETNLETLSMLIRNLARSQIPTNRILLFPGHEYSVESLQFVLSNCTPNNLFAKKKLDWCLEQRMWCLPTIPVSLYDEMTYSPYLRIALATKSDQKRVTIMHVRNHLTYYLLLPTLHELLSEFLISERFIKTNMRKSSRSSNSMDEEVLRTKLFEDIFCGNKKFLLECKDIPLVFSNAKHPRKINLGDNNYSTVIVNNAVLSTKLPRSNV